jgi:hypothetical protein
MATNAIKISRMKPIIVPEPSGLKDRARKPSKQERLSKESQERTEKNKKRDLSQVTHLQLARQLPQRLRQSLAILICQSTAK